MLQIITETHLIKQLISEAVSEAVQALNQGQQPTTEPEQNFTRSQLAEYLKCTLPTVDRYRDKGIFPFYQTGRTIYFKKSEVDQALKVGNKKKGARQC